MTLTSTHAYTAELDAAFAFGPAREPEVRLGIKTICRAPASVRRPGFDVSRTRTGILHLGCGAFHRAHQAVYTQRAMECANPARPEWGIIAASLRQPKTRDILARQDGLYTVLERGPTGTTAEIIGSIRSVLYGGDQRAALLNAFTNVRIVTVTVTASGYGLDPATYRLSPRHPDIRRDLETGRRESTLGVIVEGLKQTRIRGAQPPVILCCDNLPNNGRVLRAAAMDYAGLFDDGLAEWIGRTVQFPSSMVDRIVPAVIECDKVDASMMLGMGDEAPVSTEPYRQWVIEDFQGARPRWEAAGAQFVSNVAGWEKTKLRLLNGTHLAVAYLGALAGYTTVAEAMGSPTLWRFCRRFMLKEQAATLPHSANDVSSYSDQILDRWSNPGIAHQLSRVGRDGSEKLDARLLATVAENLAAGRDASCGILAIAAWICCVSECAAKAPRVYFEDPVRARLQRIASETGFNAEQIVSAALAMPNVFRPQLKSDPYFEAALKRAVRSLQRKGPEASMQELLQGHSASAA
jgi:fructuronate reductase